MDGGIIPVWGQVVLGLAALITAVSVIWTKVLRPGARLISATEEMIPLMRDLTRTFKDVPHAFQVLDEIVAQFRTNSGSSLRDVIDRIEEAAVQAHQAGEVLKVQVEVVRELASQDRRQLERLITLLNYLDAKVTIGTEAAKRMEESAAGVAWNLQEAQERADAVEGDPGEAADAASFSPVDRAAGPQDRRKRDVPVEHDRRRRKIDPDQ